MDLLDYFLNDPAIRGFLQGFPSMEWPQVLKKTLVCAIHSYNSLQLLELREAEEVSQKQIPRTRSKTRAKASSSKPRKSTEKPKKKQFKFTTEALNLCIPQATDRRSKENSIVTSVTPKQHSGSFWINTEENKHKSSFSSINLSENMKNFYRNEFKKLLPDEIPQRDDNRKRYPSQSVDYVSFSSDCTSYYQ